MLEIKKGVWIILYRYPPCPKSVYVCVCGGGIPLPPSGPRIDAHDYTTLRSAIWILVAWWLDFRASHWCHRKYVPPLPKICTPGANFLGNMSPKDIFPSKFVHLSPNICTNITEQERKHFKINAKYVYKEYILIIVR